MGTWTVDRRAFAVSNSAIITFREVIQGAAYPVFLVRGTHVESSGRS